MREGGTPGHFKNKMICVLILLLVFKCTHRTWELGKVEHQYDALIIQTKLPRSVVKPYDADVDVDVSVPLHLLLLHHHHHHQGLRTHHLNPEIKENEIRAFN